MISSSGEELPAPTSADRLIYSHTNIPASKLALCALYGHPLWTYEHGNLQFSICLFSSCDLKFLFRWFRSGNPFGLRCGHVFPGLVLYCMLQKAAVLLYALRFCIFNLPSLFPLKSGVIYLIPWCVGVTHFCSFEKSDRNGWCNLQNSVVFRSNIVLTYLWISCIMAPQSCVRC